MKKKMLIFSIVLIVIIVISVIVIIIEFSKLGAVWQPVTSDFEISIPAVNESVFVKKKVWGVSYDHQLLLISSERKDNFEYEQDTDYVYRNFFYLFYKINGDCLEIYTMTKSPVPDQFNSKIKIVQIELTNPEMMELLDTYENKGFKKFE